MMKKDDSFLRLKNVPGEDGNRPEGNRDKGRLAPDPRGRDGQQIDSDR
ncbi:MAG TPA: hypothetical protein VNM45_04220 [Bacillus sp. (in: firmicutes)]|nr:hypothetical protein [Bacillus sp. (in: firmicutes)]